MQDQAYLVNGGSYARRLFGARVAKWCTYLLVAFPIVDYTLRLSEFHHLGSVWDKIVLLILAIIALNRVLRGHRPVAFGWSKFAGWYCMYLIALVFAGFAAPKLAFDGLRADVYYMLFGLLIPFIIEPKDAKKFLYAAASIAILIAVHGVFQYAIAAPIPPGWVDVNEQVRSRVFSVFGSPNELGAYMEVMTPIAFGLVLADRNRIRRVIYAIGGVFCLLAMLFTYTRGAWMGLGVAVVLVAIAFERRLLVVVIVLGVIGFFLPPIHHRVMDLFSQVYYIKSSQGGRIVRWQSAFDQMASNPLFGAGIGRYGGMVASDHGLSVYSDNYYAKVLGESGLIGLLLFLAMHVRIVVEIVQKVVLRAGKRDRYLALGGLIGITAMLIDDFVENVFEDSAMFLCYFMVVGLLLLWGRSLDSQEETYE